MQDIYLLLLVLWRLRWSEGGSAGKSFRSLWIGLVSDMKDMKTVATWVCAERFEVVLLKLKSLQWRYGHEFLIRKTPAQLSPVVRRSLQGRLYFRRACTKPKSAIQDGYEIQDESPSW